MLSIRGFFLTFSAVAFLFSQGISKKELTPRELFYAAAQAPKSSAPRPAPKTVSRAAKPASKPVEIARADPQPSPPRSSQSETSAPVVKTAVQTAPMPASGEPPLGIRYTILKINSDNSTLEAAPDSVFHSGDRIRISVEANAPGYLYIINQGSSGTWKPMFPSPEVDEGSNRIEGWRPYTMPPKSRMAFDTTPGTENLFLVFSRQPEPDLEQMIYSLQGGKRAEKTSKPEEPVRSDKTLIMAANIGNPMVERLRNAYSRDLIVEKVDPNTPGDRKETAVYVVNPTGSSDSRVVADLHLVHK
jgi:hypothetical protein